MQFLFLATFIGGFVAAAPVAEPVVARAHPASVSSFPTSMPSSFPDPVQGHGALSLTNLPALPPVLDKTVAGVVDAVVGLRKSLRVIFASLLLIYSTSVWHM